MFWWLPLIGVVLGAFGTLIGAGGGFLLAPLLLVLYPAEPPEIITCISLAVVFFNAASGSWAYARMNRIDYLAAITFTAAGLPGSVLGAVATIYVSGRAFDATLGVLLAAVGVHLLLSGHEPAAAFAPGDGSGMLKSRAPAERRRALRVGSAISALVGFVSSLLGIGGGVIHVPAMVRVLKFPAHVATATSHLILALMALTGTVVHVAGGSFQHGWRRTIALSLGVVIGAQWGARWSTRVQGRWIVRGLAVGLVFVAGRLMYAAWLGLRA